MPCVFPILSLKALSLAKSGTSEGHARAEALAYTAGVVLVVLALGGALLGGLVLNIMPCVFPILSLKALSLAKSGTSETHARSEALAYTTGVVLVVLALGGAMLGLRAAGASVGWAFQLTDARVILFLLLLVLGIALNLAGLFELMTPRFAGKLAGGGSGGAFMTGALAAFIATPCTGPFMGAALGAALVLPWYVALLIFVGLGLGLALPFLLLGFVPALRRALPKPGAWMDTFRKILSVPMFLTAIALVWVLGGLKGVNGMAVGLVVALGLAVVLWIIGRRQVQGRDGGSAGLIIALALIVVTGNFAIKEVAKPTTAAQATNGAAEPFTETRLATLQGQGKPVFAYFTADWCVTCKVNEKAAIETDAVRAAFDKAGVTVLVGDWTDGDPALGRFIERHNRAGVPLYLWYPKGSREPRVLPQVLTQGMLAALPGG
jgi:thiol:disulfide interchange protein